MYLIDYVNYKGKSYYALSSPYSKDLVQKVHAKLSPAKWEPDLKIWLTPPINLPIIISYFKEFKFTEGMRKHVEDRILRYKIIAQIKQEDFPYLGQIPLPPNIKLYDHQKKGINFLYKYPYSGLLDEMGLGKCLQTLSLLYYLLKVEKSIDRAVIFCLKGNKDEWRQEIEKYFPSLSYYKLDGQNLPEKGSNLIGSSEELIITNYESLRTLDRGGKIYTMVPAMEQFLRGNLVDKLQILEIFGKEDKSWEQFFYNPKEKELTFKVSLKPSIYHFIESSNIEPTKKEKLLDICKKSNPQRVAFIFDESHRLKSISNQAFKSIKEMLPHTVRRHILTGTLVADQPVDVFSQIYLLDMGFTLGKHFSDYKRTFIDYGNVFFRYNVLSYKNQDLLRALISTISIRRTEKQCFDLPPLTTEHYGVELPKYQRDIYNKFKTEFKANLFNTETYKTQYAPQFRSSVVKLIQAACWAGFFEAKYADKPSEKIIELDNILKEQIAYGKKIIVWNYYKQGGFFEFLENRYAKYNAVIVYGDVPDRMREKNILAFKNDPEVKVLIANPMVAGTGVNLQVATVSVFLNRNFQWVYYSQSVKRSYRGGQTKPCLAVILEAEDTIDKGVRYSLEKKEKTAGYLHGDEDDLAVTREEVVELFDKNLI